MIRPKSCPTMVKLRQVVKLTQCYLVARRYHLCKPLIDLCHGLDSSLWVGTLHLKLWHSCPHHQHTFSAHGARLLGIFWALLVMARPSWTHYTHGWLRDTFDESPPLFVGPFPHLCMTTSYLSGAHPFQGPTFHLSSSWWGAPHLWDPFSTHIDS